MSSNSPLASAQPQAAPSGRLFWPGIIFGLLALHVLFTLVMVFVATRDRSFAIEPNYYQKGLHWDATAEQLRTNARLGWKAAIEVGGQASVTGQCSLTCRLTTSQGIALDGASIDLVAFPHARANDRSSAVFEPRGEGVYETKLRMARKGLWEFRLVVRRGPDTFTYSEQRRVP